MEATESKYTAIVVDDEKSSRDLVAYYLYKNKSIDVIGEANSAQNAIEVIDKLKPDLVFLDIEMPGGNGFEILKHYKRPYFKTVIVTAFNEHAISALRLSAFDYLLKPINSQKLEEAIERFKGSIEEELRNDTLQDLVGSRRLDKIVIRMDGMFKVIPLEDIVYFKAEGAYTFIQCSKDRFIVSWSLKHYEEVLPPQMFHRTHKSYIVNHVHIRQFQGGRTGLLTMSDESLLEVASRRMSIFRHWYFANAKS